MTKEAASIYYFEQYHQAECDVLHQALTYKKGRKLTYSRIKPLQLKLAWESYMRMGVVLRPNIIDSIQEIVVYNTCILSICTACMGHDTYNGIDDLVSTYELNGYQKRKLRYVFESWSAWSFATFSNNQPLLSDFAFNRLNPLVISLIQEEVYEKKILILDRILNVVHQRSDLAELYVEGGSNTLSILSASPSELEDLKKVA